MTLGRPAGRLFLALAITLATPLAQAGDRPFLATTSAAGEPDDDEVWAVDTVLQHTRGEGRTWRVAAEYAFDPQTSLQFEATRASGGGQGAGIELKRLFNSFARDDWGWGLSLELGGSKARGERWRGGAWGLTLPLSWQATPSLLLHTSLGVEKERGGERERLVAVAGEWAVLRPLTLFAEVARAGETTLANAGVRWWLKREKLALDLSALRSRTEGRVERGWVLGVSLQDL